MPGNRRTERGQDAAFCGSSAARGHGKGVLKAFQVIGAGRREPPGDESIIDKLYIKQKRFLKKENMAKGKVMIGMATLKN